MTGPSSPSISADSGMPATHADPASRLLAPLLPALRRLDKLIERATTAADAADGVKAATDSYRGLYISAEDVGRLLAREPGVPALVDTDAGETPEPIPAESRFRQLESIFGLID